MSESPILGTHVRHKQHERDELQRLVDEFHARGGKTQHLRFGEASTQKPPSPNQRRKLR